MGTWISWNTGHAARVTFFELRNLLEAYMRANGPLVTLLTLTLTIGSAFAQGGGGSSSGGSSNGGASGTVSTCPSGKVYSKKKHKCVAQSSEIIPDKDLMEQGWVLAKSGKLVKGRELFQLVRETGSPDRLNGLGYSNRKLGNFELGISYYKQALSIDPNYLDAREYLGEGYAKIGKIELAKEQLAEIQRRCGVTCEQSVELAEAISDAVIHADAGNQLR